MKKLKFGIIGLGGISNFHIGGILENPDQAVVWAICDCVEEKLEKRGNELGIPAERRFLHAEELLRQPEIDAVIICTPNDSHFEIASMAIKQRKPFALEKPVTINAEEAAILKEMLAAQPLPHMICFSYRYKSAARYARSLIRQGMIGKVRHVYCQYLQSWGLNEQLTLEWRLQKIRSGSGALGDLGSHVLDLNRFLVGEVERVFADADTIIKERSLVGEEGIGEVDVDDFCHILARLEGGVSSAMSISRFAYGRGNYQQFEIHGTNGALVYNLEEEDTLHVKFADKEETGFLKVDIPEKFKTTQIQSFINLVNGRSDDMNATMEDGYINQLTIDRVIESFTEGKWLTTNQEVTIHG